MSNMSIFENVELNAKIRTMTSEHGEPLFLAKDIADALDYGDTEKLTRRLDDDEKVSLSCTPVEGGQVRSMTFLTESGFYSAILGSQKPDAKAFKKWVTSEILPSIRKTGKYALSSDIDIRTASDALGLSSETRLMAARLENFPLSQGQKNLADKYIKKLDDEIEAGVKKLMEEQKEAMVLKVETKLIEHTLDNVKGTLTVSKIRNTLNGRSKAKNSDIEFALVHYGYANFIKAEGNKEYLYPTIKGLNYCKPTTIKNKGKNLEIAKEWQFIGNLKHDIELYCSTIC